MSGKAITAVLAALSLLCLLMVAVLWPEAASAQQMPCGTVKEITEAITGEKFRERPFAHAEGARGVVVFFANPETGTFTLIGMLPDGRACMVFTAEGFTFDEMPPALKTGPRT